MTATQSAALAEAVISAIIAKLRSNEEVVARAAFGRVTWRRTAKGTIEVKLQPEL